MGQNSLNHLLWTKADNFHGRPASAWAAGDRLSQLDFRTDTKYVDCQILWAFKKQLCYHSMHILINFLIQYIKIFKFKGIKGYKKNKDI